MFKRIIILFFVYLSVDCFYVKNNQGASLDIESLNSDTQHNIVRVIRQTIGYQTPVIPRDPTVVVMPNAGTNLAYRGVPTVTSTYGVNRGSTVVVVPADNYSRVGGRYASNQVIV